MIKPRAAVAAVAVAVVACSAASASAYVSTPRLTAALPAAHATTSDVHVSKSTTPTWHRIASAWPRKRAVTVTDVTSIGNEAWVAGNSTRRKDSIPIVQDCVGLSCRRDALPRPDHNPTFIMAISAVTSTDIWAGGYYVETTGTGRVQRPVWWHYRNGLWAIFDVSGLAGQTGPDSIAIVDLDVANKSKAFALGRYNSGDGITSTVYRWNGNGWKELSPLGQTPPTDFPGACGEDSEYWNRHWDDVVVRSGDAVLAGTCGSPPQKKIIEDGSVGWVQVQGQNPPTGGTWDCGAFVGQQLWLVGEKQGKRRIMARDGTTWSRISTKGIPAAAHVTDIHGINGNKVWAVGWAPTGHHHHIALSWHFGGGNWHATEVPAGRSRSKLVAVTMQRDGATFAVGNDEARAPAARAIIIKAK